MADAKEKRKSLLNIVRRNNEDGTKVWTAKFNSKLIKWLANRKSMPARVTFNPVEEFTLTMGIADGMKGFIKNANGKKIEYTVKYLGEDESGRMGVRFDYDNGKYFEYAMKNSRNFGTGAFYKFFNDVIRKTDVLATVTLAK